MNFELDWRSLGPERDAEWDALAGQAFESGFMQSSAWAAFKRSEGYVPNRLGLFEGTELIGGASLLSYESTSAEGQFVLCPEGPVLPWHLPEKARAALRGLIAEVKASYPANCVGLRIEPHLEPPVPSIIRNWSKAPVDLTPIYTPYLDLALSDDELLAQMTPKGRYNLRLSWRHGVEVVRSSEIGDLKTLYGLFEETSLRNEFFAEPIAFFLNLASALFPSGMAQLYLAKHEGEILSAILVAFYGRRATYLYGGSSVVRRNVMPNYALHWEAIRDARSRGCLEYDLYAYDPFDHPDHLYAGITRFKKQWGGTCQERIGAMDCVFYDRLADQVVRRLGDSGQPLRQTFEMDSPTE